MLPETAKTKQQHLDKELDKAHNQLENLTDDQLLKLRASFPPIPKKLKGTVNNNNLK